MKPRPRRELFLGEAGSGSEPPDIGGQYAFRI